MLVGRAEYTLYHDTIASASVGASALHASLYNDDTSLYGSKQQEALHFIGTYGPWLTRAVVTRIDINPRNPGRRNGLITMGSFDGSYNVATKGWSVSGELAYKFTPNSGPFTEIVSYLNYSAYYKDRSDFRDSERYILGAALTVREVKGLYIYSEFRFGRNDPYTGIGNYGQGTGSGGTNRWATTYLTNIGYYF
ncbi:hypothetical protein [Methylobacterium sp. E-066]|uniref:hypothetical protein n=1 Tax=Methylobacterium sp. E-066 TaxID=2836584 RepID=UPI001FBAC6E7|nr:hypothetical protein [Methylobacterium sp. E-066]MCJ2142409.1 hypothetical protein [Methylobacterium sp. E-066]